MGPPVKKRKLNGVEARNDELLKEPVFLNPPSAPATEDDKRKWQGFCEIESEPAVFNVMLKEFGVKGVKVQEVFGLDDDMLAMLPKPVYGLIFLFQYRDVEDDEKQETSCPKHVWFANQTSGNACATVALLNIVNNVPGLDLGDHLQSFKDFTKDFHPALRGDQIVHFEFIKEIHNSFARKMDMLQLDLTMKKEFETSKSKTNGSNSKSGKELDDHDLFAEAAFHFMAFMPIGNEVWKLDGLDRQPEKLGNVGDGNWLGLVAPLLSALMAEYEEGQIRFSLLSLVKDPIIDYRARLAENIELLQAIEERLDSARSGGKDFATDTGQQESETSHCALRGVNMLRGITPQSLNEDTPAASVKVKLAVSGDTLESLMGSRTELLTEQAGLRAGIREEDELTKADDEKAANRRYDYGPAIQTWLRMLAENGVLKELVEDLF